MGSETVGVSVLESLENVVKLFWALLGFRQSLRCFSSALLKDYKMGTVRKLLEKNGNEKDSEDLKNFPCFSSYNAEYKCTKEIKPD